MIRHISADFIITSDRDPIPDGIISVNDHGDIINIYDTERARLVTNPVERFEGIIVPGFINAHCHLELSHMLEKVNGGEGLLPFLTTVIGQRSADESVIRDAMAEADIQMWKNGIVAVGDISNNLLSREIKKSSPIHYHTFVEVIGFNPQQAAQIAQTGADLVNRFLPLPASLAPHAPYSVSKELVKLIGKSDAGHPELTSMHNQESDDENELYRYKTGRFINFYENLKINIDFFKAQARNSIQSLVPLFAAKQRILLVHNTYTSLKDIYFSSRFNRDIHWCFCPKANLYIENTLPKLELFRSHGFNITVGTDSLASNDKLCILSELKVISRHFPDIPLADLIRWATINGARFLGVDKKYGSISAGKTPGLNLITNTRGLQLTDSSVVRKLI